MAVRKHGTLVATTVATVTLDGGFEAIEVVNHGGGTIYFTVDGTTPTVAGDETYAVPSGGFLTVDSSDRIGTDDVKLISAATPAYSVTALDWEQRLR